MLSAKITFRFRRRVDFNWVRAKILKSFEKQVLAGEEDVVENCCINEVPTNIT